MGFRWPTMPGSGAGAVAQQIGNIGAQIGRIGEELEKKQARVRLDDFKVRVTERMILLGDEISTEQDEDKYSGMLNNAISDLNKEIPKGMAGPLSASYLKGEHARQLESVDEAMEKRVASKWGAANLIAKDNAIRSGNMAPFLSSIETGLDNGYINEVQAEPFV